MGVLMPSKKQGRPRNPGPASNLTYHRARAIAEHRKRGLTWTEIAARYGLSPETLYVWRRNGEGIRDHIGMIAENEDEVRQICNEYLTEANGYNGHDRHCYTLVVLAGHAQVQGIEGGLERLDDLATLRDRTGFEAVKFKGRRLADENDGPADHVIQIKGGPANTVKRLKDLFGDTEDDE